MSIIKTITVDGFYSPDSAKQLESVLYTLQYEDYEYGKEIPNFNLIPPDADNMFSTATGMKLTVDTDSGKFRIPRLMIHFESFETANDWVFAVAIQESTFNVFEHKTGVENALQRYDFNYHNLFEWDLTVNYHLKPGQGILFRPWLFHSFDMGLVQNFRLLETPTSI